MSKQSNRRHWPMTESYGPVQIEMFLEEMLNSCYNLMKLYINTACHQCYYTLAIIPLFQPIEWHEESDFLTNWFFTVWLKSAASYPLMYLEEAWVNLLRVIQKTL